jgi:hypothetical protein
MKRLKWDLNDHGLESALRRLMRAGRGIDEAAGVAGRDIIPALVVCDRISAQFCCGGSR